MQRLFILQEKLLAKIDEFKEMPGLRDETLNWERIHMISCAKIGQLLAIKRREEPELAGLASAVHDYGRIITGRQAGHAEAAYEPLKLFLAETGFFNDGEVEQLATAARNHSNKHEVGTPLEEIVKDADVLDCYQYGLPMTRPEQRARLEKILREIGQN